MKGPTEPQREVLRAMAPHMIPAVYMTSSEITVRVNQIARYAVARGSVVDRLKALEKKGLVELFLRSPQRWRLTEDGREASNQERQPE